MIFMIAFLGVLIVFAGVLPFLISFGIEVPFITGDMHLYMIIVIGIIAIIYDLKSMSLMGGTKVITFLIGALTIASGVLPLLDKMEIYTLPFDFLSSAVYSGIVIVIGSIALIYGATQM